MKNKNILGAIAILYRHKKESVEFLVVENSTSGNTTFISGAQEDIDSSELDTMNREIQEELGLKPGQIRFQSTDVRHEFIFGLKKEDRFGQKGSYQVFLADVTDKSDSIAHTEELRNIRWLSSEEVLNSLSFFDLKEVFVKAIEKL